MAASLWGFATLIIGKAAGGYDTVVEAQNPSGFSPYLGLVLILLANSNYSVSLLNHACDVRSRQ